MPRCVCASECVRVRVCVGGGGGAGVDIHVQRSEFNYSERIVLYINYLLLFLKF